MSNDEMFSKISDDIASGNTELVTANIMEIVNSSDDPYEMLKCMSLLKMVPQDGTESKVANKLVEMTDDSNGLEIASALRNLDCPTFAVDVLRKLKPTDRMYRQRCQCEYDMEEYESAYETYSKIENPVINDRVLLCSILSSLGEHKTSMETSAQLLQEFPDDYDVRVAYVRSLMLGGHDKEALKYVRNCVKDKTADSNAVAAYVMRITGNIKSAAGYATRAIKINPQHLGALEILGMCLAQKGQYDQAKIVAGAINEVSPGHKAAITILSFCEGH